MSTFLTSLRSLFSRTDSVNWLNLFKPTRQKIFISTILFIITFIGGQFYEYRCEFSWVCIARNIIFGMFQILAFPVFAAVYLFRLDIWGLVFACLMYSYVAACVGIAVHDYFRNKSVQSEPRSVV